jgi:hypothetical protein
MFLKSSILILISVVAFGQDNTLPSIPAVPKIDKLTTANSVRVAVDYNPTGIFGPNPNWIDDGKGTEPDKNGVWRYVRVMDGTEYCKALGFETNFMVYNGTEDWVPLWWENGQYLPKVKEFNRYSFDWSRWKNFADPLDPTAAEACARLAKLPTEFGAKLLPYQPIFLDIEWTKTYQGFEIKTPKDAFDVVAAWTKRFDTYRYYMGYDNELYIYGFNGYATYADKLTWASPEERQRFIDADQAMMRRLSGIALGLYNWDLPTENPSAWYGMVDAFRMEINRYYPGIKRWAIVTPTYQIYFPANIKDKNNLLKNGKPVNIDIWKRQIKYLVDDHWNIDLWNPGWLKDGTKAHIEALARYANN